MSASVRLQPDDLDAAPRGLARPTLIGLLPAVAAGALLAVLVLPAWAPALRDSLIGAEPKAYWYLARAAAFVAYGLLWLAMAIGLAISNKLARAWPGGPTAFDLHQHLSLLGLAAAAVHGLILLGDHYIGYTLPQVLLPFAGAGYRPLAVGLGQLGLYGLAVLVGSFYVRRRIGPRTWRRLHFLSFAVFGLALAHGLASGTDSGQLWAAALYWLSGASLLFLTIYRVLATRLRRAKA